MFGTSPTRRGIRARETYVHCDLIGAVRSNSSEACEQFKESELVLCFELF